LAESRSLAVARFSTIALKYPALPHTTKYPKYTREVIPFHPDKQVNLLDLPPLGGRYDYTDSLHDLQWKELGSQNGERLIQLSWKTIGSIQYGMELA